MFVERNIEYIYPEEIDRFSTAYIPNVVIKLNLAGSTTYLDFATILYKNHSVVSRKTHSASVDQSSLFIELIEPLRDYFLEMFKKYSHASIKHYFKVIRNVVKDLYSTYEHINLYDKNTALEVYKNYTHFLILERSSKLKNSTADMGIYNRKQNVLAEILAYSLEINSQEIKNSYIEILSKHKDHIQPTTQDNFQKFYKLNESVFLILNLILTTNMVSHLPLSFNLENVNIIIDDFYKIKDSSNDPLKNIKRNKAKIINLACSAFINCFSCVSAINFSQILNLTKNDLKNLNSSTKGIRVSTVKPRAGYRKIELSIPLKFKKILNEFMKFREWVIKNYDYSKDNNFDPNLLFFGLSKPLAINQKNHIIPYSENQHNLYRNWFKTIFPNEAWVPVSNIRSTVANIYHNDSKNLHAVAKKLGNTPQVVNNAYSEASESQVLSEMTETFQNIAISAPVVAKKLSAVKINTDNTLNTDMGHCTTGKPKLDTHYQNLDLDEPNCSNPISCLFCENYVVHTDREDINKLLSAKKIFEMANYSQNAENIYLVIQKINDILDYIIEFHPNTEQEILQISKQITQGKLSPFFEIMLNTLTDLGIDFYE